MICSKTRSNMGIPRILKILCSHSAFYHLYHVPLTQSTSGRAQALTTSLLTTFTGVVDDQASHHKPIFAFFNFNVAASENMSKPKQIQNYDFSKKNIEKLVENLQIREHLLIDEKLEFEEFFEIFSSAIDSFFFFFFFFDSCCKLDKPKLTKRNPVNTFNTFNTTIIQIILGMYDSMT